METDFFYHKTVTFRAYRRELRFRTSQELFSSHDIDVGTRFLLRTLMEAGYPAPARVLDIGCGYGPLGLSLKSFYPGSLVRLTDRDALAVDYARQNAALNGLDVQAFPGLGYDDIEEDSFDFIVSNIPGKAGESVIAYLLREAQYFLKPGGIVAVVVVSPLEDFVSKILAETPGAEIILKRDRSGHTVFHYRFNVKETPPRPSSSSIERGIYHRQETSVRFDDVEYQLPTVYGLPEFDTLSYSTEMLFKSLQSYRHKDVSRAAVFNPGQGHVPVFLGKLFNLQTITLFDRDLLALRYSRLNLARCCPAIGKIEPVAGTVVSHPPEGVTVELAAAVLDETDNKTAPALAPLAASMLVPGGLFFLSAGSTAVTRLMTNLEENKLFSIKSRERRRGYSLLVLEKL